ncbi:uncharacterized protein UV8b_01459 [Ustilaginoidea virens]|uniref:Hydrophobin n=1 Tax=Ustilaginoidea virens TaxID=1159556 RepID=A0A8E5HL18_USTVR|nr:uncharacterized protein UV8b_01459 [Ustilaginoidea virens]QUC17218.1 hypothetical protein UV8b_01459 [Ustilaginoidea virens]
MKYTAALVALAAAVMAAPNPTYGGEKKCTNEKPQVTCCDSKGGLLGIGGLLCNVELINLGDTCSGTVYCCDAGTQNGLVNVGLNCLKL